MQNLVFRHNILNLGAAHRYFVLFGAVPRLRYKLQPAEKELRINSFNILLIHNVNILDIFTIYC